MSGIAQPAASTTASGSPGRDSSSSRSFTETIVGDVERRWPWILGAMLLLDAVLLLYMGKGLTFFYDEWDFVQHDYGGGVHSLLAAHVGNISLFPVVVYKILFHVVGLDHYVVYRLVVVLLHLTAAVLIFVLASRRMARAPALLAMALILFLGAAWEDLLWAFQIGYMLSIVGGLGTWVLIERDDRLGDVAALCCLILSVGSSSLGIAVMIGVAVELAWSRQWRRGWIVLVPAVLYLLWYLGYGESEVTKESLINAPGYVEDLAAAAFSGLVGRSTLDWGRPLAVLGALVLLRRFLRLPPITPRLAGLVAAGLGLWMVTAAARSTISAPESSRYIYLGAVAIVLVGVELLRGIPIPARATAVAGVLVAYFAVTGLTPMHAGASGLSSTSNTLKAELGAFELASAYVPPSYHLDPQRAPTLEAGPYLHTVRAVGSSPADTPAELISGDSAARTTAEKQLLRLEAVGLVRAGPSLKSSATRPLVSNVGGTAPTPAGSCWSTAPGVAGSYTEFVAPAGGLLIGATAQPVDVVARRFAPPLGGVEVGAVAARRRSLVKFPPDGSGRPWFVRVSSGTPSEVCGGG